MSGQGCPRQWTDTLAEVIVDDDLPPDGFVAIETESERIHCETRHVRNFEVLVGQVKEEELFFPAAYTTWAERYSYEAYEYLMAHPKVKGRIRRSIQFAHSIAPSSDRWGAWSSACRRLGIRMPKQGSFTRLEHTTPIKVAVQLGYIPDEPEPEYWEGCRAHEVPVTDEVAA